MDKREISNKIKNIQLKDVLKEYNKLKTITEEDWIGSEVGCIPTFIQEFEITNDENDYILSSEIQDWLEQGKYGITMKKFGMEMKQYIMKKKLNHVLSIVKKINSKNSRVWLGIKKNDNS